MRSLSRDARHERRVQVVRLRKARYTYEEIATQTGLSRTGVFDICKRHAAAGASALRDAPSGRETGEGRLLEVGQEAVVRKLIADKTPDQLKMPYALWTRAAVADLIEQRFGIRLAVRTMGLYLARWGFMPQKPMKKAYERFNIVSAVIETKETGGLEADNVRHTCVEVRNQLPILVMTGDDNPANQSALLRAGANDLVQKPIEERLLVTKLVFQLRVGRMMREKVIGA